MFWGLKLNSGNNYTQTVEKENSFQITQATLEPNDECMFTEDLVAVHAVADEADYILCYLGKGQLEHLVIQRSLNMEFAEGEKITFYIDIAQKFTKTAGCTVHLTGYSHDLLPEECDFVPFGRSVDQVSDDTWFDSDDEEEEIEQDSDAEDIRYCLPTIEEFSDGGSSEEAEPSPVAIERRKRRSEDSEADADSTLQPPTPKKKRMKKKKADPSAVKENGASNGKENVKASSETKKVKTTFKTDGGTEVQEIVIGSGKLAKPGKKVFVKYTGRLAHNNRIFDSNINGKRDFMFRLGQGEVVKGWDHGIKGMKVGGKRRLVLPPSQGYGSKGAPPGIPPNSKLIFDVELTNVK